MPYIKFTQKKTIKFPCIFLQIKLFPQKWNKMKKKKKVLFKFNSQYYIELSSSTIGKLSNQPAKPFHPIIKLTPLMLVSIHALAFCTFSAGGIVSQHVRPIFFFGNIEYYSIEQLTKMSRRTIGTQKMSIMYVQVLHLPFFAL